MVCSWRLAICVTTCVYAGKDPIDVLVRLFFWMSLNIRKNIMESDGATTCVSLYFSNLSCLFLEDSIRPCKSIVQCTNTWPCLTCVSLYFFNLSCLFLEDSIRPCKSIVQMQEYLTVSFSNTHILTVTWPNYTLMQLLVPPRLGGILFLARDWILFLARDWMKAYFWWTETYFATATDHTSSNIISRDTHILLW
jgi:hypothetical protein